MGADIKINKIGEIILYDGACKFCNRTVNFIIQNEIAAELIFSPLQSKLSQQIAISNNFDNTQLNTIVLVKEGKVYFKSRAIFQIVSYLKFPWSIVSIFDVLPVFVTDFFYDVIANNRYRILGKSDSCIIPDSAVKSRFLDSY